MRSDKKLNFWNCMAFLPSTFQHLYFWKVPLHFLEIWTKLYPVWKREKEKWVRKTPTLTNLKEQIYTHSKEDIFSHRSMLIAKNSDKFKNSVFVIVGN